MSRIYDYGFANASIQIQVFTSSHARGEVSPIQAANGSLVALEFAAVVVTINRLFRFFLNKTHGYECEGKKDGIDWQETHWNGLGLGFLFLDLA